MARSNKASGGPTKEQNMNRIEVLTPILNKDYIPSSRPFGRRCHDAPGRMGRDGAPTMRAGHSGLRNLRRLVCGGAPGGAAP
ncbi:MAG: hypothetical protein NTU64_01570, partial [Hyphomicrobiales bacterium]|nr:hypothetical protein [Hyphomicrobiales bacterium]